MDSQIIAYNIKRYTKERGFKLTKFVPLYLGCTYHGFNWRLNKGRIYLDELITIMVVLNINWEQLTAKPKGYKKPSD